MNVLIAVLGVLAAGAAVAGLTDRDLLLRIVRGDRQSLSRLFEAVGPRALAIAQRLLRDSTEAEDVVQETFVEVWKRAAQFDSVRGDATAWVSTIARTRALDRLRSRRSMDRTVSASSSEPEKSQPSPLELVEHRQARERVASALESLPEAQRQVLEHAYFHGLTQKEISDRTGEPLGTVKTRVRLALKKLSELLAEREGAA